MTGVLTSREAWVRFASELFRETELSPEEIGAEADAMLIQYLKRFPDPKGNESAVLVDHDAAGNPGAMEFTGEENPSLEEPILTEGVENPPSVEELQEA